MGWIPGDSEMSLNLCRHRTLSQKRAHERAGGTLMAVFRNGITRHQSFNCSTKFRHVDCDVFVAVKLARNFALFL